MASMGVRVSTEMALRAATTCWEVKSIMLTWSSGSFCAAGAVTTPSLSSSARISLARVITGAGMPASLATSMP